VEKHFAAGGDGMKGVRGLLLVVLGCVVIAGCASMEEKQMAEQPMMAKEQTLYQRLGGKEAITAVVDDFVTRVAADNRINSFFATTDMPRFKRLLVEQICQASGGPCTYTGRDMKTSHQGMGVTDADFNALIEDLIATLDKFKVPAQEKNELLAVLGPMRRDIVGQ
jgi:hemoglobin